MESTISKVEQFMNQGRFLEAHSMTRQILDYDPDNLRLKQIFGLSLSKSGAFKAAQEYLENLHDKNPDDAETAGILGSVYKELLKITQNPKYAFNSRDVYLENFNKTQSYYTGINAASMSVIGGAVRKGREIANQIIEILDENPEDFWEVATLGEAHLLAKNYQLSLKYYRQAREMADSRWGWILSVSNQITLLDHFIRIPRNIKSLFTPPGIVAFIGHMIDHPDREEPRFPPEIEPDIKKAIHAEIEALNARIGYCSLACGSDIIFAECMLEAGGELHVFLPFRVDDFLDMSVRFAGTQWEERYNKLADQITIKFITTDAYNQNDMLFNILGRVIFGATFIRSKVMQSEPYLLTVLSESDMTRKIGGSRDLMELWPYKERCQNINPDRFRSMPLDAEEEDEEESTSAQPPEESGKKPETRGFVYCIINTRLYLEEDQSPGVVWDSISDQVREWFLRPLVFDIHGDRLISVYRSSQSAAEYVFFIKDYVAENFGIEISSAIHMGPVEMVQKDLEKVVPLTDTHFNKVSDILNVALSGSVYSSEVFSSVLALESKDYNFSPVGTVTVNEGLENEEVFNITRKKDDANL